MRRREFLQRLGFGAAACLPAALHGAGLLRGDRAPFLPLAAGTDTDHLRLARRVIDAIGGSAAVARSGDQVLVKPTLAWNRAPHQGANVQPAVLRAVIERALEAGASRVAICDRTSLRAASVHRVSGADRVVRSFGDARVRLVELREQDFVPLAEAVRRRGAHPGLEPPKDGSEAVLLLRVARQLLEADRVINVATLRHHPSRRYAMGFSNLLGLIAGWPATPEQPGAKDSGLAVIAAAVRPDLTILDATRPILANGPAGDSPADVGVWDALGASRDPIAVDSWGARRVGLDPRSFPHLLLAEEMRLGRIAPADGARIIKV